MNKILGVFNFWLLKVPTRSNFLLETTSKIENRIFITPKSDDKPEKHTSL